VPSFAILPAPAASNEAVGVPWATVLSV
jgi:hypothetical protein